MFSLARLASACILGCALSGCNAEPHGAVAEATAIHANGRSGSYRLQLTDAGRSFEQTDGVRFKARLSRTAKAAALLTCAVSESSKNVPGWVFLADSPTLHYSYEGRAVSVSIAGSGEMIICPVGESIDGISVSVVVDYEGPIWTDPGEIELVQIELKRSAGR